MTKKQRYMTRDERYQLEALLRAKVPVTQIARQLGFCRQTIYNEIKRGAYVHTYRWWDEKRYSADKAQQLHAYRQTNKGRPLKIGTDRGYARFLEDKMLGIQEDGRIDKRVAHPALPSIAKRPENINQREEKGHWEIDLVVGKAGSKPVLLTMVEQKEREPLVFELPDKRAESVRKIFDRLEQTTPDFHKRFKSITMDNGSEFLEYEQLIQSIHGRKRFDVYYCHSYSA